MPASIRRRAWRCVGASPERIRTRQSGAASISGVASHAASAAGSRPSSTGSRLAL